MNTFELVKTKKNDVDFDLPQIKINKKYKQPKLKKCNKVGCTL